MLDATPILEAFGHASTSLNPNSSRFGKLIDLQFDCRARLQGARVQVYLLEKVRIVRHAAGERGYHVFYQLLSGAASPLDMVAWGLTGLSAADFAATAQGAHLGGASSGVAGGGGAAAEIGSRSAGCCDPVALKRRKKRKSNVGSIL